VETKPITIRMPKESLEKWLSALRSFKYGQGTGRLRALEGRGYCCLGVLQMELDGAVETYTDHDGNVIAEKLPTRDWCAAHDIHFVSSDGSNPVVPYLPTLNKEAAEANDCGRFSFTEIADAIEACAEGF
jgi:hypothetical protein